MPKYPAIVDSLRQQVASGKYSAGARLPSENELARKFHVSRPTAARALRDLQQLGLLERRVGSGTYVRTPTIELKNPAAGVRHIFGLLVPGLGNTEILDPICNEITRFAQAEGGASVLWGDAAAAAPDEAERLCADFVQRRVDGVFFAPLESAPDRQAVNQRIADALVTANIAVVLLDRDVPDFPGRSRLDLVGIDNFQAGVVLAEHLIHRAGARRICFVARPMPPSTTDLRLAGCREAVARSGAANASIAVHFGDPADTEFVQALLASDRPDAIIGSNDRTVALLQQTLSSMGLRVPQDVRLAGFDDVRYATLLAVPLTTVRQPCRDIGRAAVAAMLDRIAHPELPARMILLPTELVIRRSCGVE